MVLKRYRTSIVRSILTRILRGYLTKVSILRLVFQMLKRDLLGFVVGPFPKPIDSSFLSNQRRETFPAPSDSSASQHSTPGQQRGISVRKEHLIQNSLRRSKPDGPDTIEGWTLREVIDRTAILEGPTGIWRATCGETVPRVDRHKGRIDERLRELAWYILEGADEPTARRRAQQVIEDDPRKD
jgi:hypothetical protein